MNNASDIERMLAHIGDPDMGYREFGSPRSETRARRDWSLLDSAAGGKGGEPVDLPHEPSRVSAPVVSPRSPAYVERELPPTPEVRVEAPVQAPVAPAARGGEAGGQLPRGGEAGGQLQRVFAKLRGEAPLPRPRENAPASEPETPLSQIFRRLS